MSNGPKCIVFLGPPGCGKGTQSHIFKNYDNIVHLSTGDLFRDAVASESALGIKVRKVMSRGDLVDDETVIDLIKNELAKEQSKDAIYLFDGFPRNLKQAQMLDNLSMQMNCPIKQVICFEAPDEVLIERITGRRVHLKSGRVYHIKLNPPKVQDRDDITGEPLTHREDDNEKALRKRLEIYHQEIGAILAYYTAQKILMRLDATQLPDAITLQLRRAILTDVV